MECDGNQANDKQNLCFKVNNLVIVSWTNSYTKENFYKTFRLQNDGKLLKIRNQSELPWNLVSKSSKMKGTEFWSQDFSSFNGGTFVPIRNEILFIDKNSNDSVWSRKFDPKSGKLQGQINKRKTNKKFVNLFSIDSQIFMIDKKKVYEVTFRDLQSDLDLIAHNQVR